MSLETKIETLTTAVLALTEAMLAQSAQAAQVKATKPAKAEAPAPVAAPAPTPVEVMVNTPPIAEATIPATPALPEPPAFLAPPPAAPVVVPFNDGKGLIEYMVSAFKALGSEKGAKIQDVLTGLGYTNANDVKPEHYGALHAGIEALRG